MPVSLRTGESEEHSEIGVKEAAVARLVIVLTWPLKGRQR